MRYLAVTFPASSAGTEGIYDHLVPYASRRRGILYNLTLLDDGTTLELVRVEGDRAVIVAELESRENLLTYEIFASRGQSHHIYLHVDQEDELLWLLAHLKAYRLIIDFPISYGGRGVTVRLVGEPEMVQRAFNELPPTVRDELDITQLTEYVPDAFTLHAGLTSRQRDVLDTAVQLGYYDDPRRATIVDIANELGISQATASEHLRKLEARVFQTIS